MLYRNGGGPPIKGYSRMVIETSRLTHANDLKLVTFVLNRVNRVNVLNNAMLKTLIVCYRSNTFQSEL